MQIHTYMYIWTNNWRRRRCYLETRGGMGEVGGKEGRKIGRLYLEVEAL